MSRFRDGFLEATSRSASSISVLLNGDFDLALLVGSWDMRGVCLAAHLGAYSIKNAILLGFAKHDARGVQQRNHAAIVWHLNNAGTATQRVDGVSEDVEVEWDRIWSAVKRIYKGRALRCLIDLSACPRYYSLGLVGALIATGMASEVVAFYAEGLYDAGSDDSGVVDVPFSVGRWNNTPIPFLRGTYHPSRRRYYLVSVGFEGTKTARILARDEPDRVSLLYPIPGVTREYETEVIQRNAAIVQRFQIPERQIIQIAAGDAISVWSTLTRLGLERADKEDIYYLCCGTKAHALGMSLRAISLGAPTVLYNVPERHNYVPVRPAGTFWTYRIRDLSSMVSPHEA